MVAHSGLEWTQINVAHPDQPVTLVWVRTAHVPEISAVARVADLVTLMLALPPQLIYVAASAPAASTP